MPLINTAVPNLIQGVSQQSDATRFAGQCEEQENALSSVADGLKKRPNTRHIARLLTSAIDQNNFAHFIDRNETEKYVVILDTQPSGDKLYAFNLLTGNPCSITSGTTTSTTGISIANSDYLHNSIPRKGIKALSVGDTTFLVNTGKTVIPKTTKTAELEKEAVVFVKQGAYTADYEVTVKILGDYVENAASSPTPTLPTFTVTGTTNLSTGHYIGHRNGSTFIPNMRVDTIEVATAGANLTQDVYVSVYRNSGSTISEAVFKVTPDANGQAVNANITLTTPNNEYQRGYVTGDSWGTTVTGGGNAGVISTQTAGAATGDSGDIKSTTIINNIATQSSNGGSTNNWHSFTSTLEGNTLILTKDTSSDTADFEISTTDSLADTGIQSVYKEIDALSSLPVTNKNGFRVKIIGDAELSQDDYYVKFSTNSGTSTGQGVYTETVGFGIVTGYEASSMPHVLINNDKNSFVLREAHYEDRLAGDDFTNPLPSFVGKKISNLFFFKNRLGILCEDNVVMSESGFGATNTADEMVYNFGRTTVTTLLDSDPIDVSVSSGRVTNLKSATGFQENLVVFSDNNQFVLKGGDLLTPKTVSITPITNFGFEDQVDLLPLGSYIYFPFTRGAFTGMREFTVNASTDNYDATEITEHVPAYIPKNIIDMAGTTSEDMIVLLSGDEKGSLYIYNYFWNNNQKVLSAWSKFTFTGEIRGIEFIESTLYAVITNGSETNLVEMPLESGLKDAAGFVTHLDMRVASTVTNGSNQITLPYTPADNSAEVYTTDGLKLNCTNSGATVTLTQAVTADTDVFVGVPYTMKYTFSEQIFKAKAGQGSSPSNAAKLMVRNGSIYFDKTAFFKVKVTPKHRDTTENVFTPDIVGSSTLGSLDLDSGFYRFPVFTKAQDTTITIENESALPSNFQSAEFESFLHSRSNRYG